MDQAILIRFHKCNNVLYLVLKTKTEKIAHRFGIAGYKALDMQDISKCIYLLTLYYENFLPQNKFLGPLKFVHRVFIVHKYIY